MEMSEQISTCLILWLKFLRKNYLSKFVISMTFSNGSKKLKKMDQPDATMKN